VDVSIPELHFNTTAGLYFKQENVLLPPKPNLVTRKSMQTLFRNICKEVQYMFDIRSCFPSPTPILSVSIILLLPDDLMYTEIYELHRMLQW